MWMIDRRRVVARPVLTAPVLAALMVAGPLVAGCVQGEGPVVTEQREVRPFTRLEAGSGLQVVVVIGPAAPLDVAAQANIQDAIATDVAGDTLHIEATDDFTTSEPVTVTVTTPELSGIDLSGGAQAQVDGLEGAALDVSVKGGGRLAASGTVGELTLTVDGGSGADLAGLTASRVHIAIGGGSEATVNALDLVDGSASAGSHVSVLGGALIEVAATVGAEVTAR